MSDFVVYVHIVDDVELQNLLVYNPIYVRTFRTLLSSLAPKYRVGLGQWQSFSVTFHTHRIREKVLRTI